MHSPFARRHGQQHAESADALPVATSCAPTCCRAVLCLQETRDGELVVFHDAHLLRAFPLVGPNMPAFEKLTAAGIQREKATPQVRWFHMLLVPKAALSGSRAEHMLACATQLQQGSTRAPASDNSTASTISLAVQCWCVLHRPQHTLQGPHANVVSLPCLRTCPCSSCSRCTWRDAPGCRCPRWPPCSLPARAVGCSGRCW